jgi:HK97 family phage prohead protease
MTEQNIILRRAPAAPASWKPESRQFEATLATGAAVARTDPRGAYDEVLSLDQSWPASVPLLDGHQRESVDNILGTVSNIRTVADELVGTATLSAHSPLAQRVAAELTDGARFGVSIGYRVRTWLEAKTADGRRAKVATKFDLLEASLVPLAADGAAGIRGVENMPEQTTATLPTEQDAARAAVQARAQINQQIRSIGELAGLDRALIDAQIDDAATVDQARAVFFEALQQRSRAAAGVRTATASVGFSGEDPQWRRAQMSEALFARSHPEHNLSEAARPFYRMTLLDMQRDCEKGIETRAGAMTMSDFPLLLGDYLNKELRNAYTAAPAGIKRAARFSTSRDFRLKHKIMVDGPLTLSQLDETGEFKSPVVNEGEATYALKTFGNIVKFSRQSIVNDNLGGLSDPARMLGRAAAEFEASALVATLQSTALMEDGYAPFSAQHNNLAATPAAISIASLSLARQAMRQQRGLSGEPISATPKFLIVGPQIETAAEQVLHTLSAVQVAEVNPFSGTLQLIVEPCLAGSTVWYLAAGVDEVDGIEFAHLADESGPQVLSELPFAWDGIAFRIRLDFGSGWIDFRGWQKNAGA